MMKMSGTVIFSEKKISLYTILDAKCTVIKYVKHVLAYLQQNHLKNIIHVLKNKEKQGLILHLSIKYTNSCWTFNMYQALGLHLLGIYLIKYSH